MTNNCSWLEAGYRSHVKWRAWLGCLPGSRLSIYRTLTPVLSYPCRSGGWLLIVPQLGHQPMWVKGDAPPQCTRHGRRRVCHLCVRDGLRSGILPLRSWTKPRIHPLTGQWCVEGLGRVGREEGGNSAGTSRSRQERNFLSVHLRRRRPRFVRPFPSAAICPALVLQCFCTVLVCFIACLPSTYLPTYLPSPY